MGYDGEVGGTDIYGAGTCREVILLSLPPSASDEVGGSGLCT